MLCMSLPYFLVVFHTIMINFIENILSRFESCFSRKAAFGWFVVLIIGLMLLREGIGGCGDGLSEETFFRLLNQSPELRITRIIQEQQEDTPEVCEDLLAS